MKQTKQFIIALTALMLGAYGTQARHIAADARGIAANIAQVADDDSIDHEQVFIEHEEAPEFPGGTQALNEYIKSNKLYPQEAMDRGIEGRVIAQFVVDSMGNVCEERVVRSVDTQLDGEAIRLIRNMPRWKPGKQWGRPVRVRYTIPITFTLPDSATKKVIESPKPKGPTIEEAEKKPLIVLLFANGAEIIAEGKQLNYVPCVVVEFDYLEPFDLSAEDIADADTLGWYMAEDKYGKQGKDGAIVYHVKEKSYGEVTKALKHHWFNKGSNERLRTIEKRSGSADEEVVEYESKYEDMFIHYETQPEFPGGMEALMDYLKANIRYPQEAKERGKQGRVIVQFIVEEDGTLTGEQVLKPVDPQLDAEAIRIARSMPKWKPGKTRGKPTRMRFTFPVSFRLKDWFYGGF
jgi:protein TonB